MASVYCARTNTTSLLDGSRSTSNSVKSSSGRLSDKIWFALRSIVLRWPSLNLLTPSFGFFLDSSANSLRDDWSWVSSLMNSSTSDSSFRRGMLSKTPHISCSLRRLGHAVYRQIDSPLVPDRHQ